MSALPDAPTRIWAAPGSPSGSGTARTEGPGAALSEAERSWAAGLPAAEAGFAVARADVRKPPTEGPGHLADDGPLAGVSPGTVGVVLDGAFDLLRFRFGRLIGLAAVLFVPIQLLELVLALTLARSSAPAGSPGPFSGLGVLGATGASSSWQLVFLGIRTAALCVLGLGVGALVQAWWDGRDPTFSAAVRYMLRRSWVGVLLAALCSGVKVPMLCFGLVGFFLADALLFIAGVIAGAERLGPLAAFARSFRLCRAQYGFCLGACLGGFVICQVLQFTLVTGPLVLMESFQPPEGWVIAVGQASSLVLLVVLPLTACIAARAYVELRCRVDGVDLARRQEALGLA